MRLFISWSGEASGVIARWLHDAVRRVLPHVDPWISSRGIDGGSRFSEKIAEQLEKTDFGVLCMTKQNVSSEWIMFEAGALSKQMEKARVVPLLLDLEFGTFAGTPLSPFHARALTKEGVTALLQDIDLAAGPRAVPEAISEFVDLLWAKFEPTLTQVRASLTEAGVKEPPPPDVGTIVLNELLPAVRDMQAELRVLRSGQRQPPVLSNFDDDGWTVLRYPLSSSSVVVRDPPEPPRADEERDLTGQRIRYFRPGTSPRKKAPPR